MITAASMAYGLTDGGAYAEKIGLTDLGRRIIAPTIDGDDLAAKREAVLRPRVVANFLEKYNGSKMPRDDIAKNVLEEMGVPTEQTERAFMLISQNAQEMGFLTTINGTPFIDLSNSKPIVAKELTGQDIETAQMDMNNVDMTKYQAQNIDQAEKAVVPPHIENENKKVFITHGKDQTIVEQIKKLLIFGDFIPIVSVERQATAKPVPDKVMDDMRSCSAGIVHVGAEAKMIDNEGKEHRVLNQNVLIEIGAAMALYNRRFILLVERGVDLPSNLQGLYEVRYKGSGLDHESTMALLEAFAAFKVNDTTTSPGLTKLP